MVPYFALAVAVPALTGVSEVVRRRLSRDNNRRRPAATAVPERRWTFFDLIAVLALVTFSAVRFEVGTDFGNYAALYRRVDETDWAWSIAASPQEVGFTVLMLAVKSITDHPQALFWVTSALAVIPAYAAIKQGSDLPSLSVLLYVLLAFYVTPFNAIRQGIAVSLLFYAFTCLPHRRGRVLLVAAVATSMHTSAVIAVVLMWALRRWELTLKRALLLLGAALAAAVVYDRLGFLDGWVSLLNARYEQYLASPDAGLGTYLQIASFLALVVYAAVLGRRNGTAGDGRMATYIVVGVGFMIVGTQALVISRLALFFTIFLVLLLPNRIAKASHPGQHASLLAAASIVFFAFYLSSYAGLLPYQTHLG